MRSGCVSKARSGASRSSSICSSSSTAMRISRVDETSGEIMTRVAVLSVALLALSLTAHAQQPPAAKSRLLVLTDIEADPDDTQSLVRLMLYSNEIDLEGLVATTSIHMQSEIHPDSIRQVIHAYDRVRANLLKHAPGYPAAADLLKLVVEGQPSYGMAAVGKGRDTAGSQLILRALDSPDPRPLWVTAWGGPNT